MTTPHDPAPGSPALPLATLLADPELGLEQIAGPVDDRLIGTAGTTEVEDPAPYLIGGELLLTAGVRLPQTPEGIDAYVRGVVGAGAAALGFGVAPVYDEVPPDLVTACERHSLPLLRVPVTTPFVAIGRSLYGAIAEASTRDLRHISQAQSALASAAARPDAMPAVLHQLSSHLGAWTVLIDAQGRDLFSAGPRPAPAVRQQMLDLAVRTMSRSRLARAGRTQPPTAAAEHHAGSRLTVHTLPGREGSTGPLVVGIAATTPPTVVHRAATGVATVLLSLLTSPRHALGTDSAGAGALVRLMLGASPADVAPALLPADAPPGGRWVVVHGHRGGPEAGSSVPVGGDPVQLAALGTALSTSYLDLDGDALRALVPGAPSIDAEAAARLGWTLGLSSPSATVDLPTADTQAERALRRALATGEPVVHHRAEEQSVHGIVNAADARALARARFAPLDTAAQPGPAVLLETLRTWLALHCSWDQTATALQVHRNTVRHRIGRVADLLETDVQDPDVRMELWFALHWLPGERQQD
ncbi:PucR family transcriptional regulator [Streptomyces sp. NBC_01351]|uniref:helix-turn-helix domain-containing protein n=1 Tax=Streptomyces sp. NBC_01351 TaxID=2903833 RepID=UPI002E320521|nr:PucR family transcriptional regulator ligand-binding domain-containing protein [Streptomyces sp. NBC_01351]